MTFNCRYIAIQIKLMTKKIDTTRHSQKKTKQKQQALENTKRPLRISVRLPHADSLISFFNLGFAICLACYKVNSIMRWGRVISMKHRQKIPNPLTTLISITMMLHTNTHMSMHTIADFPKTISILLRFYYVIPFS